jgi:hypothetical protein
MSDILGNFGWIDIAIKRLLDWHRPFKIILAQTIQDYMSELLHIIVLRVQRAQCKE